MSESTELVVKVKPLSTAESSTLIKLERVIARGRESFIEVANSLAQIHAEKLYREMFPTFKEYLAVRWDISPAQGYRLIKASEIIKSLPDDVIKPVLERQTRPLNTLDDGQRVEAWTKAVNSADGNQPTCVQVEQAVAIVKPPAPPLPEGVPPGAVPEGVEVSVSYPEGYGESEPDPVAPKELTDAEWLATLPARQNLTGDILKCFDAEALAFRELQTLRAEYRDGCNKVINPMKRLLKGHIGPWLSRHQLHFRIEQAVKWQACGDCKGTGWSDLLKQTCPTCHANGYHV